MFISDLHGSEQVTSVLQQYEGWRIIHIGEHTGVSDRFWVALEWNED